MSVDSCAKMVELMNERKQEAFSEQWQRQSGGGVACEVVRVCIVHEIKPMPLQNIANLYGLETFPIKKKFNRYDSWRGRVKKNKAIRPHLK